MGKLSCSPYLPNSPLSPTFMGPLHFFVFCIVGDCGKIVVFALFAKFAAFVKVYMLPLLLCVLPRWRLWQNCHFPHICQICRFSQRSSGPYTALCFASLSIVPKLSFSTYLPNSSILPTFMGPLPCFVLCLLGDCGKIFIFAIFAKLAYVRQRSSGPYTALCFVSLSIMAKLSFSPYLPNSPLSPTFMGPLHCFVFCLVGDCDKIVFFVIFAKFAFFSKLLWGTFTALCFASLAILPKLSFSTYLPKLPLFPTFMGPLYCFVPCLVGDCSKIVIFAIFAKFAAFANFCGTPIPLRGLPRC